MEHMGKKNLVIYASKKFWLWEKLGYEKIVRTYLRLPIYVRRSEILYF